MSRVSGHIFSSYYNKRQDRKKYVTRRNTLTPVVYATKWLNKTKGSDEEVSEAWLRTLVRISRTKRRPKTLA